MSSRSAHGVDDTSRTMEAIISPRHKKRQLEHRFSTSMSNLQQKEKEKEKENTSNRHMIKSDSKRIVVPSKASTQSSNNNYHGKKKPISLQGHFAKKGNKSTAATGTSHQYRSSLSAASAPAAPQRDKGSQINRKNSLTTPTTMRKKKKVIQMRDTDRLLGKRNEFIRSNSMSGRIGGTTPSSLSGGGGRRTLRTGASLKRQDSGRLMVSSNHSRGRSLQRGSSHKKIVVAKQSNVQGIRSRSQSIDSSSRNHRRSRSYDATLLCNRSTFPNASGHGDDSMRSRSSKHSHLGSNSQRSARSSLPKTQSQSKFPSPSTQPSTNIKGKKQPEPTVIQRDGKTVVLVPVTKEQAKEMPQVVTKYKGTLSGKNGGGRIPFLKNGSYFPSYFPQKIPPMEETPPKSLVLIWIVVFAELAFDLATTIIAFLALVEEDDCCGERIELWSIPMTVTVPFFLLVMAELVFLSRAVILFMWPSILTGDVTEEEQEIRDSRGCFRKWFCCYLRWKAKMILKVLNFLVLLNPFFGCVIAWMLLYQSDKVESFIVLGLEGGSIFLHFVSVYLEGSAKTWSQWACHCIPLIPFFVSIALILFYLKQGGVCYLVDKQLFLFTGCELCIDGTPPIDGLCQVDGANYTIDNSGRLVDFTNLRGVDDIGKTLTDRADQGTYCESQNEDGPSVNFCFFDYS